MAIGTLPNFTIGKSKPLGGLGGLDGLRDQMMRPLPEELRRRHKRVHKIADLMLQHLDWSQQKIENLVDSEDPEANR